MAYVGPYQASPGATNVVNANPEWNASDGVFITNPDPTDATNTPLVTNGGTTTTSATGNGVWRSGVANYLNQFGFVQSSTATTTATNRSAYKRFDNVGELYYAATRYFRNLGNLANWTSTDPTIKSGQATNDQFPVIESWDDPIQYTCSTNYIIGIGDIHSHYDADLPGAASGTKSNEVNGTPTDDSAVNSANATDFIAKLENLAGDTGGASTGTATNCSAGSRCNWYTSSRGLGDNTCLAWVNFRPPRERQHFLIQIQITRGTTIQPRSSWRAWPSTCTCATSVRI